MNTPSTPSASSASSVPSVVHTMIDLETMSAENNAAILSIGAIQFTQEGMLSDAFYTAVSLQSCIDLGFHISAETIEFWMKQSQDAKAAWMGSEKHIDIALWELADWLNPESLVWGNGADFDLTILKSAYKRLGRKVPWNFRNTRCYRTIKNQYPHITMDVLEGTEKHNALHDAKNQAAHLLKIAHSEGLRLL